MQEATIIGTFNRLLRTQEQIKYHMQLGFSGNALELETIKAILMEKGLTTETEFRDELGKQIKKVNDMESKKIEEEKKKLAKPTPEQAAVIEGSKNATDKEADRKAAEKEAEKLKLGRNEPCHCGSGKKFKKCCIDKKVTKETPKVAEEAPKEAQLTEEAPKVAEEAPKVAAKDPIEVPKEQK